MPEITPAPKRQQILTAAFHVFAEKGYHNAKIEEIAQVAQVGKGTVYEYFQSKNQLFQEMLKAEMTAFEHTLTEKLESEESTRGKLVILIEKNIELGNDYRPLAKIAFMETNILEGTFRDWMINLYKVRVKIIEGIIQKGINNGEIRPINPRLFTSLFYSALGALHSPFTQDDLALAAPKSYAEEIIDYFYHGIAI